MNIKSSADESKNNNESNLVPNTFKVVQDKKVHS